MRRDQEQAVNVILASRAAWRVGTDGAEVFGPQFLVGEVVAAETATGNHNRVASRELAQ